MFLIFTGCYPFEYETPQYEFYDVTLDASKAEYISNGYYLFKIDEFITKVDLGEIKSIHFEYFNGLVCQFEMNRVFNCKMDSVNTSSSHIANGNPLADIIKINYNGGLDSTFLARNTLLYPDYFTTQLDRKSKTIYLPAKVHSDNRIVLYKNSSILLDTTFLVETDTVTFDF